MRACPAGNGKGACALRFAKVANIRPTGRRPERNIGAAQAGKIAAPLNRGNAMYRYRAMVMGLAAGAALLAGTATAQQAQRKVGVKPEPGVETTVTVGSPMYERFNMVAVSTPKLRDDLEVSLGIQGKVVIPSGSKLVVQRASPLKVCTEAQDTYVDRFVGPRGAACLYDTDGDGAFDKASAETVMFTDKKIKPPAPYDMIDAPAAGGSDYFRNTLTYLGSSAGTLRVSYREFSHDMARPAFTEELTFPLSGTYPETITWRDTKITLLGLDGSGLRYRVEAAK